MRVNRVTTGDRLQAKPPADPADQVFHGGFLFIACAGGICGIHMPGGVARVEAFRLDGVKAQHFDAKARVDFVKPVEQEGAHAIGPVRGTCQTYLDPLHGVINAPGL